MNQFVTPGHFADCEAEAKKCASTDGDTNIEEKIAEKLLKLDHLTYDHSLEAGLKTDLKP